ncbi:uncharacterized protein LOC121652712 [Melanotaenia boesemani]|uniref:uncharacterized protein LOC121651938 n=1 Tax=Melanotaenia boesemani TaxID=1250792 RepID=UPI001C03DCD5|nr:uncharacterized protein LOC121651938 [Melanotaenia boesemani]XP_041861576.1 uncharacterized protein LOC121652712 [Melanotaenia boesemani]XP_041861577.1 uncharacterized protein LOC121652712 [Melanotaenia boesemani]
MEKLNLIKLYFKLGLNYKDILYILSTKHQTILSLRTLKRILKQNGLFRRIHFDTLEETVGFIREQLQGSGALHGYRWMYAKCKENGLHVRKEDVRLILSTLDPDGTETRRRRRLQRRTYFAKGPNFVWHADSYDKLKPFGICINGAIDGFSRRILWLNAYHTSSDPKVIGGYFLETIREIGGCACILRTDMGTENSSVRDMQRYLRRNDDDNQAGDKSFIYGRSTANQRIESWWGFLRKECVDFWLDHFHRLKHEGNYAGDFLDKNLMLFCFCGLIQDELDSTKESWNSHVIRPSSNELVPHGRPDAMYLIPELYDTQDYLCKVSEEDLIRCEDDCIHRSDIACDEDVFILCTHIMAQNNLPIPADVHMAIDLYLFLRRELITILNPDR